MLYGKLGRYWGHSKNRVWGQGRGVKNRSNKGETESLSLKDIMGKVSSSEAVYKKLWLPGIGVIENAFLRTVNSNLQKSEF